MTQRSPRGPPSETLGDDSPRYRLAPRGLLSFYSLLSIGRRAMSGYDIMKEIEGKTEGAWRPGPGAVYPVLRKLAKQGFVVARERSRHGQAEVLYEITPAGLRNITMAKKSMGSSGERLRTMSSLFIDLMEPDDLIRFAVNSFELQAGLVRTIVESEKSSLSESDKLFVLRQYKLSLERELARSAESIERVEGVTAPRGQMRSRIRRTRK